MYDTYHSGIVQDFLTALSVCNTVMLMPDTTTGKLNVVNAKQLNDCLQVSYYMYTTIYLQNLISNHNTMCVHVLQYTG